nr:hypothetical protein [Tanacetum cinerariifolium]
ALVSVKKTNDVVKLQALIDRKKVVITKDTTRQALRLNDADGVDCLSNEEIFAELAHMGYEKPPPNLTFYKAFFSAQCHLPCHRIGKGFLGVETPLFVTMLVPPQVQDVAEVKEDEDDKVSAAPTSPLPTPATTSPPQQEPILSPPQAQPAPPSSPPQPQPAQTVDTSESSMTLLNTLMETCAILTQKVANLEKDKVAQVLEIVKLKQRVRKSKKKRKSKSSSLKRLRKVGTLQRVESSNDTVMDA